jgi:hypothetical protein
MPNRSPPTQEGERHAAECPPNFPPSAWNATQLGIAAFVEDTGPDDVLQAILMSACSSAFPE